MHCCFLLICLIAATYGQQTQNTLEIYIRKTVENFREKMKTGIPGINMPILDPLNIPIIDLNIKEGVADVQLKITNLICNDLSTFNVKSIKMDMATMTLSAVIFLPGAAAKSQYDLNGKILGFIPLYGKGAAVFGMNDLEISIKTKVDLGSGKLHLETFGIQITFSQIQVYLENILGGGDLGNVVNTVINSFGKAIFDSQKGNIEWTLNNVIRNALNTELAKINLGQITYNAEDSEVQKYIAVANANNYIDTLLTNLRPIIKGKEPFKLPSSVSPIPTGFLAFNYGSVAGVHTVFRTGDVKISTNPKTGLMQFAGSIGVQNILVACQLTVLFLGITYYPVIRGIIHGINIFFNVLVNLKTGQKALAEFTILAMTPPQLIVENLPPIVRTLVGLIMKMANAAITNALRGIIQTQVRNVIQTELNKIPLIY